MIWRCRFCYLSSQYEQCELCQSYLDNTVFIFLFFSHEHEPIRVHVRGHNGDARYIWTGEGFEMEYAHNIKTNDLRRIERMIAENTDIIINRWYEIFGKEEDEDNQ